MSTTPDGPATLLLQMVGRSGPLDVWLGCAADRSTLEADVREAGASGSGQLSDLAMALGEIARRHKLEVRVLTQGTADGPRVLALFGRPSHRGIRRT